MGLFERLRRVFSRRQKSPLDQLVTARRDILHGQGPIQIPLNEIAALKIGAFFAAVRCLAETIASLPVRIFERRPDGGRAEVLGHPAGRLLRETPNAYQTPFQWAESSMQRLLVWGNSIDLIERGPAGEPLALHQINPYNVEPEFRGRELFYRIGGQPEALERDDVLHVPWIGSGVWGYTPIQLHAETLGLARAQDRFTATFFANGARPSLIIEMPHGMGDEAWAELRREFDRGKYSGLDAWRPMLLEGDLKAHTVTMPLADAELLDSRKFQGEEIGSRIFRLPPHVLGYLDRSTFNNVEAMDLYYVKHTLRPWLVRREQELERKLLTDAERGRLFIRHNLDAITRGDLTTRYNAHAVGLMNGFLSVNEVRAIEDLNPVDGGDEYRTPMNQETITTETEADGGDDGD